MYQYKPIITLIGRPNVGKSTLFNYLTKSKNAIIHKTPGVTRDYNYGECNINKTPFIVVDTGGLSFEKNLLFSNILKQIIKSLNESYISIFIVDGINGLQKDDLRILKFLRINNNNFILAINKSEGKEKYFFNEFYELGIKDTFLISSSHGIGINSLIKFALKKNKNVNNYKNDYKVSNISKDKFIKLSIIGRPNVGKSTLINSILSYKRTISSKSPGTTRDPIKIKFNIGKKNYIIIDTCGLRKKRKIFDELEKISVIKTIKSIELSNIVLLILDAEKGIFEQDLQIAKFSLESGKGLVIAINKWDKLSNWCRKNFKEILCQKFNFLHFFRLHTISALNKKGINQIFKSIDESYKSSFVKLSTYNINKAIKTIVYSKPPVYTGYVRPKILYAHQGGQNPTKIIIHGNYLNKISRNYKKHLENNLRIIFGLYGAPLFLKFN